MSQLFCTLAHEVEIQGIGLHSGQAINLRLCPSSEIGVRFARVDLPGRPEVSADIAHVSTTTHATTIQEGTAQISTIEHLLAALWTSGLTHARVEIDGPEVPILDGSAAGWMELLAHAGRRELDGIRPIYRLQSPVWLEAKGAQMFGVPISDNASEATFRLSVGVDYDTPGAGAQTFDEIITAASFARELAPARTFTLADWLEPLRATGLIKGGSLDNAVVIDNEGTLSSPLRFDNELARHKALDCIGDLALALCPTGAQFQGHLVAIRAGHAVHRDWTQQALQTGSLSL